MFLNLETKAAKGFFSRKRLKYNYVCLNYNSSRSKINQGSNVVVGLVIYGPRAIQLLKA